MNSRKALRISAAVFFTCILWNSTSFAHDLATLEQFCDRVVMMDYSVVQMH